MKDYDRWKLQNDRDDAPDEEPVVTSTRVNMRAQAPGKVKDENGDAWGDEWSDELGIVYLDAGGTMVHGASGWVYQPEPIAHCEHCGKLVLDGDDYLVCERHSGPSSHLLYFHKACWRCPKCGTNGPHWCPADIARD